MLGGAAWWHGQQGGEGELLYLVCEASWHPDPAFPLAAAGSGGGFPWPRLGGRWWMLPAGHDVAGGGRLGAGGSQGQWRSQEKRMRRAECCRALSGRANPP
ncbi:hypothetical protein VPH35_053251 [Triticum aestivum]